MTRQVRLPRSQHQKVRNLHSAIGSLHKDSQKAFAMVDLSGQLHLWGLL